MNAIAGGAQMLPDHSRAPLLHAGFWRRVAAYLIDMLIMMPVFFVLEFVFIFPVMLATSHGQPDPTPAFAMMPVIWVLFIVLPWLFFALCESSKWQATPGKLALGLRVTDLYGRRIGFGRATGRTFGKYVSSLIFNVGYMMAGWTQRKQCLHDMMADTCVVRRDALVAFESGELQIGNVVGAGLPGWAIALIVVGACFFAIVPILAILAAIAIPAYQDYVIRSQIAEGLTLSNVAKVAITEYAADHDGALPVDDAAAGLNSLSTISGKYVSNVQIIHGNIVVTYGNSANQRINGGHIMLLPDADSGAIRWVCGSNDIKPQFLPPDCRVQLPTMDHS